MVVAEFVRTYHVEYRMSLSDQDAEEWQTILK